MKHLTFVPPFQTTFNITTNCNELIRLLKLKYGKYMIAFCQSNDTKNIVTVKKGHLYDIEFENKIINSESGILAIDDIIFNHTVYDKTIFALHGAAVEYNGKAYLFLASTTSGKTTLTSYLTSNGFGYITDDCILLDRKTFEVYPYNTPIHLRDGGVEVLKRFNALPSQLEILDDGYIKRYIYTPKNSVDKSLPVEKIFFINRTEKDNILEDLDTTSRMSSLMHAPITVYTITPEYLKFISSLSKTNCCKLCYCDMDFVA